MKCGDCRFWRVGEQVDQGNCRHDLPQTVQMQTQHTSMLDHGRRAGPSSVGLQVIAFWPTVHANYWCGKYRPLFTWRVRSVNFLRGLVGR